MADEEIDLSEYGVEVDIPDRIYMDNRQYGPCKEPVLVSIEDAKRLLKRGAKLHNEEDGQFFTEEEVHSATTPSATLVTSSGASTKPGTGQQTVLPQNFPGREHLVAAGVDSVEKVKQLSRDEIVALKGIGETTADKIGKALVS